MLLILPVQAAIIQNTKIARVGRDIELSWDYNPAYPVESVDIWVLSGENIEFARTASRFSLVNRLAGTSYKETLFKFGDGQNCYYRIVPAGTSKDQIFDDTLNDRTVGKVDLKLKQGFNLIALPLLPQAGNRVTDIFTDQLKEGDQVVYFDNKEKDYRTATYSVKGWDLSRAFSIFAGQGFFVRASSDSQVLTFLGRVYEDYKPVIFDGANLVGNSTPQTKELNKDLFGLTFSGTPLNPQDAIYSYGPANKAELIEDFFAFSHDFVLPPGAGYWYYRKDREAGDFSTTFEAGPSGATFQIFPSNKIKDRLNKKELKRGCVVQFLTSPAPPNDSDNHVSNGDLLLTGKIGGGIPIPTLKPSSFAYFLGNYTGDVYVRVWDTNDISGSVKGRSYATLGPFNIPQAPVAPMIYDIPSFYTRCLCQAPGAPDIRVDEVELDVINRRGDTRVSFTIVPTPNIDVPVEVAPNPKRFIFMVRKKYSKNWERQYASNGRITVSNDNYYQPGLDYEIIGAAASYFGISQWDTRKIVTFSIPTLDKESPFEWSKLEDGLFPFSIIKRLAEAPRKQTVKLTISQ
ncbi:MAG TPA: hypothetical protein VMD02_02410 [Candidatus Omnitrophota bacterium]|nr:hypothetical protein [Candidatus Omnitrophota bacterium]